MSAEGSNAVADVPASAAERLMQQHAADEAHKVTVCLSLIPELAPLGWQDLASMVLCTTH